MDKFGCDRGAALRIGVQGEQRLSRGGDMCRIAADIERITACANRDMQTLFDLAQIGVERAAQVRERARIAGLKRELKRFSR